MQQKLEVKVVIDSSSIVFTIGVQNIFYSVPVTNHVWPALRRFLLSLGSQATASANYSYPPRLYQLILASIINFLCVVNKKWEKNWEKLLFITNWLKTSPVSPTYIGLPFAINRQKVWSFNKKCLWKLIHRHFNSTSWIPVWIITMNPCKLHKYWVFSHILLVFLPIPCYNHNMEWGVCVVNSLCEKQT